MIPYSIHVAAILAVCLAFYKLLLQKETYYRLNRLILLACLAMAFLLPLIPVPRQFSLINNSTAEVKLEQTPEMPANFKLPVAPLPKPNNTVQQQAIIAKVAAPGPKPTGFSMPAISTALKWAFWLYWCGVAISGANLLVQVMALLYQAYKNPGIRDGIFRIVELDDDKAPCSFGNSIYINPAKYDWETYNQILIHEKVHIQQGHSFDLLLAELMLVLQWFNPFAWFYRREMESNLEFLTDDEVLNRHCVEPAEYQLSLLKVSVPNYSMRVTTNYNQSLLKKRIVMMNAKKSNVHTMWKYFMLVPTLLLLVCGLNKPVAMSNPVTKQQQIFYTASGGNRSDVDFSHGIWFATIIDDKIDIEFKADNNNENHNWSSSSTFNLKDFGALPKAEKTDFTLTREAGTVTFNGKFDGDQGYGHYKFSPDKDYQAFMAKQDFEGMEDDTYFSFFMMNIKKDYVQFLKDNGFKNLTRGQLMSMSAQKINANFISYWRKLGYTDLKPNELTSLKFLKIDSAYVNEIRRTGYTDLTIRQLISFKQQHITGEYINGLKKAIVKVHGSVETTKPTAQEIITSKATGTDNPGQTNSSNGYGQAATLNNASGTVGGTLRNLSPGRSFNGTYSLNETFGGGQQSANSDYLSDNQIITMKMRDITPEYIQGFEAVGLKNLPINSLMTFKAQGITPDFIKGFQDIGITDLSPSALTTYKFQGITPEFIKGFQAIGYKVIPASSVYSLKSQKITPEYVKGFQDLGYKEIPISTVTMFKSRSITPELVKSYQALGYEIPLNEVYSMTSVSPDYIKAIQALGYKNVSISQYSMIKRQGVTPEFIEGFKKLGFDNVPVMELMRLKIADVTPEFVSEMKKKGFESKELSRYIELKNFNSNKTTGQHNFQLLTSPAREVGTGNLGVNN